IGGLRHSGGAPGNYSNSAVTGIAAGNATPASREEAILQARVARARLSGPSQITKDASVAEMDADGNLTILVQGTNDWVCFPGNENRDRRRPNVLRPYGPAVDEGRDGQETQADEYGTRADL